MQKDKLQICSSLLSDSIVNFFSGNSVETTIHTSFAALTLTRDICKYFFKGEEFEALSLSSEELAKKDSELLKGPKKGTLTDKYNGSLIHLATAIKHADQSTLDLTTFGGIEDASTLVLAVRDYEIMTRALNRKNLLVYDDTAFIEVNGKPATRTTHLISVLGNFAHANERLRTQNGNNPTEIVKLWELERDSLLEHFYDKICKSGLRKNTQKNEGVFLIPSWDAPEPVTHALALN